MTTFSIKKLMMMFMIALLSFGFGLGLAHAKTPCKACAHACGPMSTGVTKGRDCGVCVRQHCRTSADRQNKVEWLRKCDLCLPTCFGKKAGSHSDCGNCIRTHCLSK